MPWDPDRYHQFQSQRSAPFEDLLGLVRVRPELRVVDLGCGTGELTSRLAQTLPGSDVLGLDTSPEMLARARIYSRPGLRFESGDQAALGETWDLIFSNAALQWSGDHQILIPRLFECLAPDGQMAIQVPSNHTHLSHRTILDIAGQEPFRTALHGWTRRSPVLPVDAYAVILFETGALDITVFEKVYPHVLENAQAVLDWISGTAMVPYFERLPGEYHDAFSGAILQCFEPTWPAGPVFYPFKRTFLSVRRPA